ncbi:MAG: hypothetical protein OFPII_43990 [Osedax symbiont Rs1]|nr:MAG: hypothetical protein OFPII_43990 [Osedax symbiont Rs1]
MRLLMTKKIMQKPSPLTMLSTSLLLSLISHHTLAAIHLVDSASIVDLNAAIVAANADSDSLRIIDFGAITALDIGADMYVLSKNTTLTVSAPIVITGMVKSIGPTPPNAIMAKLIFEAGSAAFKFIGTGGGDGLASSNGSDGIAALYAKYTYLTTSSNSGSSITGGAGGNGGAGGDGGDGGIGLQAGHASEIINGNNITGGKGGDGGGGGNGGNGHSGVAGMTFKFTNSGNIMGGVGGSAEIGQGGNGGKGGSGVIGGTLYNSGSIKGGGGGNGDTAGNGGNGVEGSNLRIFNSNTGNINGGIGRRVGVAISSDRNSRVYNSGSIISTSGTAITFYGGNNLLVLKTGSSITGHVNSSGGGDTLFSEASSTITGNVSGFSTFKTSVTDNTNYSKLNITENLTLLSNTNITVDVANPNFNFSAIVGTGFNDVISANTITGGSAFTVTDNSLLFDFDAVLDTNTIDLTLKVSSPTQVLASVLSANKKAAKGAAVVLDSVITNNPSSTLAAHFVSFSTAAEVANAVESTLPAVAGGASLASSLTSKAVMSLVSARQKNISGLSSGDGRLKNQHFWLQTFGSRAEQDNQQGVQGYDVDSYGLVIGVDGEYSATWQVGAAFSYANSDVNSRLSVGKNVVSIDSYQANVYASKQLDEQTLWSIQSSVGQLKYDSSRLLFTNDIAKANYDGRQFQLHTDLARHIQLSEKTAITPYIGASYRYIDVNGYRESGAGALNLIVKDDNFDSLVVSAGFRHQYSATKHLSLTTELGLGYDLMTDRSSLTSSYAGGGAQFTTEGIKPAALTYDAAIGMQYKLENGTNVTAKYSSNGREHFKQGTFKLNARWMF